MTAPDQHIRMIVVAHRGGSSEGYSVGLNGVTRIEPCDKPGMYCDIPYLRVWRGDVAVAEFCSHNIVGTYFEEPPR